MNKAIYVLFYVLSFQGYAESEEFVTNPQRDDGFGSQFQTIVFSAMYAELNHKKFVYTPFKTMEHNYDNDASYLTKKEELINFIPYFELNNNPKLQENNTRQLIDFFEANVEKCAKSQALIKIKEVFRQNKKKEQYFDNNYFNIAIHIRRLNAHDSRIAGTDTSDGLFNQIIDNLNKKHKTKNVLLHIYSQGDIDHFKKIYSADNIVFHINDSLEDTFTSMVLADALVTSPSSLSYIAAFLSEGTIYYIPFWHPPLPHWINVNDL